MKKNSRAKTEQLTKQLVLTAILIAMQVVLSRFLAINLPILKIGFSFVPIMLAAYFLGPVGSIIVATVSDLVGSLAFPTGPFFPGFTLTAVVSGLIFGIIFYKKCPTLKIIVGVIAHEVICGLLLNTLWLSILYSNAFSVLIATRVWQILAMIVVEIVFAELVFNRMTVMKKLKKNMAK